MNEAPNQWLGRAVLLLVSSLLTGAVVVAGLAAVNDRMSHMLSDDLIASCVRLFPFFVVGVVVAASSSQGAEVA